MAAASDKARFYLEQSVPELQELLRKKIFSPAEISSVTRQRSDFEHKINARGSTPADFARYAEFEVNVDALRRKRVKRMGSAVKKGTSPALYNGQRRIFFVFDRGNKKHPGDVGLWLQTVEYARSQKADKKLATIFANVLRLHPTRPELWIYAARFAIEEHGDVTEARSYIQRGLRFNRNKKEMWVQYLRLEMSFIAKLQARRQILGISAEEEKDTTNESDDQTTQEQGLPQGLPQGLDSEELEDDALKTLDGPSTKDGAIPSAIFDAAMAQFEDNSDVGLAMLDVLHDYAQLQTSRNVLRHVQSHAESRPTLEKVGQLCNIWTPTLGVAPDSPDFPGAMRRSLKLLKERRAVTIDDDYLVDWTNKWLTNLLKFKGLDEALQKVAQAMLIQER